MKSPIVIIGVGEMGGVFARGLLKLGHPLYPLRREDSAALLAEHLPDPELVLVAVGEAELPAVLQSLPAPWRERVGLLQNELLPSDWAGLTAPTVISVWFEKKAGQDHRIVLPSPIHGRRAVLLAEALGTLGIPTECLTDPDRLLFELVLKNLYILTTNIAGLQVGGTVSELWSQHQALARRVGDEVIALQEALTGVRFDHEALYAGLARAFAGDPEHRCMGRSAPARLARAITRGEALGLELPRLRAMTAYVAAGSG